jgi:hypothetical protein
MPFFSFSFWRRILSGCQAWREVTRGGEDPSGTVPIWWAIVMSSLQSEGGPVSPFESTVVRRSVLPHWQWGHCQVKGSKSKTGNCNEPIGVQPDPVSLLESTAVSCVHCRWAHCQVQTSIWAHCLDSCVDALSRFVSIHVLALLFDYCCLSLVTCARTSATAYSRLFVADGLQRQVT